MVRSRVGSLGGIGFGRERSRIAQCGMDSLGRKKTALRQHKMTNHQVEVDEGRRFQFGKNWTRFLGVLDEDRIREAERSLCEMLGVARLDGKTFIDVGSGSGLFSLAAYRLGASVYSFDYDPQSVATTLELRRRYAPGDARWQVENGSVLDSEYVTSLGQFDVAYSWGVLHHTGDMWRAMDNVVSLVGPGGHLFIAL